MPRKGMLRIGLIGAGWHATADHAPALRHCADADEFRGRVELTGVFDVDRAKAADLAARLRLSPRYDSLDGDVALTSTPSSRSSRRRRWRRRSRRSCSTACPS